MLPVGRMLVKGSTWKKQCRSRRTTSDSDDDDDDCYVYGDDCWYQWWQDQWSSSSASPRRCRRGLVVSSCRCCGCPLLLRPINYPLWNPRAPLKGKPRAPLKGSLQRSRTLKAPRSRGLDSTAVGDEGGFAPAVADPEEAKEH